MSQCRPSPLAFPNTRTRTRARAQARDPTRCGAQYSRYEQVAFCDVRSPATWPAVLQLPAEEYRPGAAAAGAAAQSPASSQPAQLYAAAGQSGGAAGGAADSDGGSSGGSGGGSSSGTGSNGSTPTPPVVAPYTGVASARACDELQYTVGRMGGWAGKGTSSNTPGKARVEAAGRSRVSGLAQHTDWAAAPTPPPPRHTRHLPTCPLSSLLPSPIPRNARPCACCLPCYTFLHHVCNPPPPPCRPGSGPGGGPQRRAGAARRGRRRGRPHAEGESRRPCHDTLRVCMRTGSGGGTRAVV